MQKNAEFITDKKVIFKFFLHSDDKSNVIGSLLSTKTLDFKSDYGGETMLMKAIHFNLRITPELLKVSDVKYESENKYSLYKNALNYAL